MIGISWSSGLRHQDSNEAILQVCGSIPSLAQYFFIKLIFHELLFSFFNLWKIYLCFQLHTFNFLKYFIISNTYKQIYLPMILLIYKSGTIQLLQWEIMNWPILYSWVTQKLKEKALWSFLSLVRLEYTQYLILVS